MWWKALSAAYDAGCIGYWYKIPPWHQAQIIAVHEMKNEIAAIQAEPTNDRPGAGHRPGHLYGYG